MATNIINNQLLYTVKNHPEWFMKAMKKAVTIKNDFVRVLPNVTKDVRVKTLISEDSFSKVDNRDCAWEPTQRITLDSKIFTVDNFKINYEECLEDLDSVYSENIFNSIGATKDEFPTIPDEGEGLEQALMTKIQNGVANDVEKLIWGTAAVDGVTSGILVDALADSNTIKVTKSTITSANVVAEIEKVYNAIPDAVLQLGFVEPEKAQVRIFVGVSTYRYLKQALGAISGDHQVVLPNFTYVNGQIRYMDVEIVVIPQMPADTMIAASRDNLVFVTDLLSDTTNIKAQMGNDLKDESMWYVKGAYRAKGGYIFSDEIVIYA